MEARPVKVGPEGRVTVGAVEEEKMEGTDRRQRRSGVDINVGIVCVILVGGEGGLPRDEDFPRPL